ncbi:MAG: type I glutamate--ammonia ligase [Anaerolineae bacterium]|nr:type I glutamate--ammonia ligase [Anaerolineae bacterium]
MFSSFEEAHRFVQEQDVQMVDLKFTDLWGRWHHLTIPAGQFTPALMENGVGFDGSAVGIKSVKAGDMVLVPDLGTGFVDPFWEVTTLSFICTTLEADTKAIFGNDPRNIAIQAEAYMCQTGIADRSLWGPEFEFYVFDYVSYEYGVDRCGYVIETSHADWGQGGEAPAMPLHGGYHAIPPVDKLYNLRTEITMHLQRMGVPVKYHHHEVGGPGQCEIETPLMGLVEAGDATMKIKYVTKMVAQAHGLTVTFMPKPLYTEAGSGMHFHQHLFKGEENVFYDPQGYGLHSAAGLAYISGLLLHGPALLGITNPSTNSYRRLVPGYEAPVNAFFSLGNRSAAVRIPRYATRPDKVRMEFRPPDGTCNVYLALAAQLLAGIDGIQRQLDPVVEGFGPIDADIFAWSTEQRAQIKPLPTSLREALEALHVDHDFMTVGEEAVFSDDLIERWIASKMEEDAAVRVRPHPYEMKLYYNV